MYTKCLKLTLKGQLGLRPESKSIPCMWRQMCSYRGPSSEEPGKTSSLDFSISPAWRRSLGTSGDP